MKAKKHVLVIAVTLFDHQLFGCAHCGHEKGKITETAFGTILWECCLCQKVTCMLIDGVTNSTIAFLNEHNEEV